ncbi:hypothetical protein [Oscillibacter ruminantium]|uniref:hypothetical protein n=1 Tax=Oscillibacter ruminantium TaxID=1263547 RepID=UPI00331A09F0
MYITLGTEKHYAVTSTALGIVEVRYILEDAPDKLGDTIKLWTADGGMCLRTDTVADWSHPRIEGNSIILSNTAPAEPVRPSLSDVQAQRIAESKTGLAEYLESHPLTWTDGKQYSVTEDKQALLTGNLAAYQLAVTLGQTTELTWNATGEECTVWTFENLAMLAIAIKAYVKPLVAYQQKTEIAIRACSTVEDVEAVTIDYEAVS